MMNSKRRQTYGRTTSCGREPYGYSEAFNFLDDWARQSRDYWSRAIVTPWTAWWNSMLTSWPGGGSGFAVPAARKWPGFDQECCEHPAPVHECPETRYPEIVVRAHAGERRVLSILLENTSRRPREIEVVLGKCTVPASSGLSVQGKVLGPVRFTLEACQEREVVIEIEIPWPDRQNNRTTPRDPGQREETGPPDVEDCVVATADLIVQGCGTRPIRLAVVIIPRECTAYHQECGCTCC